MSEFDATAPVGNDPPAAPANDTPISARDAASALSARRANSDGEARDNREPAAPIGREADAAPHDEAPGETDQRQDDPPETASIEPPRSWTKDDKEAFRALPREAQERIANIERLRETEFRRSQNEAAEQRKAVEAERRAVEQQRSHYDQALPVLIQTLQAQQAGEFADIKTWQDVHRMQQDDPYRYQRWDLVQKQASQATAHYQAQQQRQRQEQDARFATWTAEQDKTFAEYAPEFKDPKALDKASREVKSYLVEDVGIPERALMEMWGNPNGVLHIRDAKVQRVIRDAAKYRAAEKAAKDVRGKPVPPVQRPGTASSRQEQGASSMQALTHKLDQTGSAKDAAARVAARRAAAARRSG